MEKKQGKILIQEDEALNGLLAGAFAVKIPVSTSYGPKGKNILTEKGFGRPVLTRDGVTIAKDVYFSDRLKNMGAQIIIEAAEATNRLAGDGTSATAVLACDLFENGVKAINAGQHPMEVREMITKDSYVLLEALEKLAIPVKEEQLEEVATVSVGDPLVGKLIAEALIHVGKDGGILTEKAPIAEVEREYIDGYYLQSGFTALQGGKKEIEDPYVLVSSKRITSATAVNDLITQTLLSKGMTQEKLQQSGKMPAFVFVGEFDETAYLTIVNHINSGRIDAIVIKTPPQFGGMSKNLLEDIAVYAGCVPITESTSREFNGSFVGHLDKVVTSKSESTLFADKETKAINDRIAVLKAQIEEEPADAVSEKLRDRLAKLEGKICIFKIGGATETEKEELEFRIEDAINSTRNAYNEGIVAGGGVTLLQLSKLDISDTYSKALQSTFKQLLINAGLEAEVKLREALEAPKGMGYNLREGDKLVDVVKEGVIDPVTVPREVIKNATSAIGGALTIGAVLIFQDEEK